jgi:hypothetical protein
MLAEFATIPNYFECDSIHGETLDPSLHRFDYAIKPASQAEFGQSHKSNRSLLNSPAPAAHMVA